MPTGPLCCDPVLSRVSKNIPIWLFGMQSESAASNLSMIIASHICAVEIVLHAKYETIHDWS